MFRIFGHYIHKSLLLLLMTEAVILSLSIYLAVEVRFSDTGTGMTVPVEPLLPKALVFCLIMIATMTSMGLYQRDLREGIEGMLIRMGASFVLGLILLSMVFYFSPPLFLGRGAFGYAVLFAITGIAFSRVAFLKLVDQEALKRRILVLGTGKRASSIAQLRRSSDLRGSRVVGFVHMKGDHDIVDQSRVMPLESTLLEFCKQHQIDEIVIAVDDRRKGFPVEEILDCKMSGIQVVDKLTFFERQMGKLILSSLHPSWLIFSEGFHKGITREYTKRAFDISVSFIILVLTFPIIVLTALAIWMESGFRGPIFYRQVRVGQNWRLFQVMKFRSMCVDAEKDGVAQWAQQNDARVTRIGKFIRKVRIDELPQLINVLRGDMSFVGPRPERPMFVEQLSDKIPYFAERHRVKPGITGWAQIMYPYGASEHDSIEKLQYDLYYVKNYSLFLDLMILFQTAEVILWGKGAR
ncbi:MAG: TIGR03013 family PEP-CTERM/XrtA system glycosyltransferase [Gammaproteobacteria bacterium]|nr:TIGR03013 family PEP-CTERM/XrtA system glycosyltransferase [Gammaproteobacteria bacterium]MDH5593062.1 TIGR03013 family PEP-CTERM/XrtA system glycosyltransferase [Gammaproteobacteria bacterium]